MKNTTKIGIVLGISFAFFCAEIAGEETLALVRLLKDLFRPKISGIQDKEYCTHCRCGTSA